MSQTNWSEFLHDVLKIMIAIGLFILVLVVMSWSQRKVTKESRAYVQVLTCMGSIPVAQKTAPNLEKCWDIVQRETKTNLERYDRRLDFGQ